MKYLLDQPKYHKNLQGNRHKELLSPGNLAKVYKFLIGFETRYNMFKLTSFDRNHSAYFYFANFLKQYSSQHHFHAAMEQGFNMTRQKVRVHRHKIAEEAEKVFRNLAQTPNLLEFDFQDEEGTGIGPTLEFYSLLASELCGDKSLFSVSQEKHDLSLTPVVVDKLKLSERKKLKESFKTVGRAIAKALVDNRLFELPLSGLVWKQLFGKVSIS